MLRTGELDVEALRREVTRTWGRRDFSASLTLRTLSRTILEADFHAWLFRLQLALPACLRFQIKCMAHVRTRGVPANMQVPGIHLGDPAPAALHILTTLGLTAADLRQDERRREREHIAVRAESLLHAFVWYKERRQQRNVG